MDKIISGKEMARGIYIEIRSGLGYLDFRPRMFDLVVGDDVVSLSYARLKKRVASKLGLGFELVHLPEAISEDKVIEKILEISKQKTTCGIILQLPLPSKFNQDRVLSHIPSHLDIDCISPIETEKFYRGESEYKPPTAVAIMQIIESLALNKAKISIVILGKGKLVGKPTHFLLTEAGYNVISLDRSDDRGEILKSADIVISGTGSPGTLKPDDVKQDVVIIDAGSSEDHGSVVGDVNPDEFMEKVSKIAPVPGGVGPLTVALLLNNAFTAAKKIKI